MKFKKGNLDHNINEISEIDISNQTQEEKNNQKKNDFITIQSVTEKGKKGLKNMFGSLFGFLEDIFGEEDDTDQKETHEHEKYIYRQVELENISLYENDDIVEEKEIEVVEENNITTNKQLELLSLMSKPHENKYIVDLEQEDNDIEKEIVCEEIELESHLDAVKSITVEINIFDNKLKRIIDSDKSLKNKREDILVLKGKIQDLKDTYYEKIVPNKELLKNIDTEIDPYNLHLSPKEMNNLLQKCDIELSVIKKHSKNINETKKISGDNEFEQIKSIIEEKIEEQTNDIDELKKEFKDAEIQNKRSTLVTGIYNFLSKTINLDLNLLPYKICKNKFAGMLGSIVILNNRLRSMRKIIRKENNNINCITYKDILEKIKNTKLCIEETKKVLEDSSHQLESLKQEFIMEFYYDMDRYPESEDIMTAFSSIEYQITSKNNKLDDIIKEIEE